MTSKDESNSMNEEGFKQQILFDESTEEHLEKAQFKEQIVFEQDAKWLPVDEQENTKDIEQFRQPKKASLWSRLALLALSSVVVLELVDFFTTGFSESPITTSLWAIVLGSVLVVSSAFTWKEFLTLKHLKRQHIFFDKADNILNDKEAISTEQASRLCEQISANLPLDITSELEQQWQQNDIAQLSGKEVISLYNQSILPNVDKQALAIVSRTGAETTILVAISPVAVIDMLILFWRNMAMINRVAGLYGVKLGYFSRIRLLRDVFKNMIFTGATEVVTDLGLDLVSADTMAKFSGRLAQGLGSGLLTARLGLKVIEHCRPLPKANNQMLTLTSVRKQLVSQVQSLVLKKK